jgi:hypothetical protein
MKAMDGHDHKHRLTQQHYFMDGPDALMSLACEDCGLHDGPPERLDPTANFIQIVKLAPPGTELVYDATPMGKATPEQIKRRNPLA